MGLRRPRPLAAPALLAALLTACGADGGAGTAGSGATVSTDIPGAFEADRGHYGIEHENEVARILRAYYGPGEASPMHSHPDYCFVFIDDGTWGVGATDGTTVEMQVAGGDFGCAGAGAHEPANLGSRSARVIVIEMKPGAGPGRSSIDGPDPLAVDPEHYQLVEEFAAVRISRITYDAGEVGVEHGHPAHCLVWLVPPAGPRGPAAGSVECHFADVHAPEAFASPVELLLIEFKGRAVA